MTEPKVYDYVEMIWRIRAWYSAREGRVLTDYKLGLMCKADGNTIARIASGKNRDPRDSIAQRLRSIDDEISRNPSIVPCETSERSA